MRRGVNTIEHKVTVVPIINVSLVVVLTLMMISPFLAEQDVDVDLPQARAAEANDADNIEITFTEDRKIIIGEDHLALHEVRRYMTAMFDDVPHAVAVIKADQSLPYGEVEKLIAEVEAASAPRIALATREREGATER